MKTQKELHGTLDKNGNWQDPHGKPFSNELTKTWNKGKNVKYPKKIRDQMDKAKREAKITAKDK